MHGEGTVHCSSGNERVDDDTMMNSGSNDTYRIFIFLLNTMKQWIKGI